MNSQERVLAAINHKTPDRVPVDLGGTCVTGIHAITYKNLKDYLGIKTGHVRIYDPIQQLAQVEDEIIDYFNLDVLDVGRTFNTKDEDWYEVHVNGIDAQFPNYFQPRHNLDDSLELVHEDGTVIGRMSQAALVMDPVYYPALEKLPENYNEFLKMMRKNTFAVGITPPFSNVGMKHFWKTLRKNAIELKSKTKKPIILSLNISTFEFANSFRRMDKFLIDILRHPSEVEKFLDMIMKFWFESLGVVCTYVGDVVDIIRMGDDLGENNGPIISPRIYRKLFKPRHEEVCDYIKKHSSMKIFYHGCGSLTNLLPDLIETGIDILNPVQISARGMDPKYLKENFGDDITFWGGGVDTRNVICWKTPEEVKKHVLELLEIFTPGGGYVWSAVHNILPDAPPQNIVACFDAIKEFNEKYY